MDCIDPMSGTFLKKEEKKYTSVKEEKLNVIFLISKLIEIDEKEIQQKEKLKGKLPFIPLTDR